MTNHRRFDIGSSTSESFEGDEALLTAVRSLVWDGDDDFLRARIQKSRMSGVRVLLPSVRVTRVAVPASAGRKWLPRVAFLLGCAATIVVMSVVSRPERVSSRPIVAQARNTQRAPALPAMMEVVSPWPRMAYAQSPEHRPAPYAAVRSFDIQRIRPEVRSYIRMVSTAYHDYLPHSYYAQSIDSARMNGVPIWRIVHTTSADLRLNDAQQQPASQTDTLCVNRATLQPIVNVTTVGHGTDTYRNTHRFGHGLDSNTVEWTPTPEQSLMLSRNTRTGVDASFVIVQPIDTARVFIASESAMELVLRALPLRDGWRGSVSVPTHIGMGISAGKSTVLNLRVAGVDTVDLFSGRIPAWRVLMETGPKPEVWYVSQETGETLLVENRAEEPYFSSRRMLMAGLDAQNRAPRVKQR